MRQNRSQTLGAVVLALATLAAVIFAFLNFQQRSKFELVDDGVAWLDTDHGIAAWKVAKGSPADSAGRPSGGDRRPQGRSSGSSYHALEPGGVVDAGTL